MSGSLVYAGIGARKTPDGMLDAMRGLAERLAQAGWQLRSGGAHGADEAFASGADGSRTVFLPWRGYNQYQQPDAVVVRDRDEAARRLEAAAARCHPAWEQCSAAVRKLHRRNAAIVLGSSGKDPVRAVVCWTPQGSAVGGTGIGIRLAREYGIPVFNLAVRDVRNIEEALTRLAVTPKASSAGELTLEEPICSL